MLTSTLRNINPLLLQNFE